MKSINKTFFGLTAILGLSCGNLHAISRDPAGGPSGGGPKKLIEESTIKSLLGLNASLSPGGPTGGGPKRERF